MNPKIRLLALSLLAAVAAPAFAENLEITGELLTSTCAVQSTGGTITVAMGQVDLASVNAATRAGQKNFSISLIAPVRVPRRTWAYASAVRRMAAPAT